MLPKSRVTIWIGTTLLLALSATPLEARRRQPRREATPQARPLPVPERFAPQPADPDFGPASDTARVLHVFGKE